MTTPAQTADVSQDTKHLDGRPTAATAAEVSQKAPVQYAIGTPSAGPAPSVGTPPLVMEQDGTTSLVLDGGGLGTIWFPKEFPTALLRFVHSSTDAQAVNWVPRTKAYMTVKGTPQALVTFDWSAKGY